MWASKNYFKAYLGEVSIVSTTTTKNVSFFTVGEQSFHLSCLEFSYETKDTKFSIKWINQCILSFHRHLVFMGTPPMTNNWLWLTADSISRYFTSCVTAVLQSVWCVENSIYFLSRMKNIISEGTEVCWCRGHVVSTCLFYTKFIMIK